MSTIRVKYKRRCAVVTIVAVAMGRLGETADATRHARRFLQLSVRHPMEHQPLMNADNERPPHSSGQARPAAQDRPQPIRIQVANLLGGAREAILEHGDQDYRLRITANGKLILTK